MPEAEVTELVTGEVEVETPPTAEEIAAWKAASEKLTAFGGDTALTEAENLRTQLGTDEGVTAIFIEAGRALGLGVDKLEGLFKGAEEIVAQHEEEHPEDKPLTKAEIMALVQETVVAPLAQQQLAQSQAAARASIDATVRSLHMDPEKDKSDVDLVLRLADKYVEQNDLNPDHIAAAVRKGFDDFGELSAERKAKYLADKREVAAKVPSNNSGSTGDGSSSLPEPANVKEAAKRARARMRGEAV